MGNLGCHFYSLSYPRDFLLAIPDIFKENQLCHIVSRTGTSFSKPMVTKRERPKPYSTPDDLRSRIMRSNKSHGNLSTELTLARLMRANHVFGWRRRVLITGRPDFVFKQQRVALFIDGCYWHGCKCRRLPKKNRRYWQEKFETNQARDKRVTRQLRAENWTVLRFWEHQIKKEPGRIVMRIANALANSNRAGGL